MNKSKNGTQVRMTVWLDRDTHSDFTRLHPVHGAFTAFVRRSLERHVAAAKADGRLKPRLAQPAGEPENA